MASRTFTSEALRVRRGITLLEVIISLGILSVGLASVVALIPAGGAQAQKALIEDRRGAMASAALADAVTRGFLARSKWAGSPTAPYLIDPLAAASLAAPLTVPRLTPITIPGLTTAAAADEACRAQDDLVYTIPDNDDPAIPAFLNTGGTPVKRASEGNFSWLATLVPLPPANTFYRLSVVEFHRRPLQSGLPTQFPLPVAKPTSDQYLAITFTSAMSNDDVKSLFPPGAIVLCADPTAAICEWRRVAMASPTRTGNLVAGVELTVDRDVPANVTHVYVIEGAVGLAECTVRLEEMSPWSQ